MASAPSGGDRARESIGRYLARQRKLRGIGLEELAALTRIPLRSLERLEAGAFDHEPDGFARGFVRTVATAIGLDADETVSRMLDEPGIDARVSFPGLARALVLLAAALVIGIAGIAGWAALQRAAAEPPSARPPRELPVRRDAVRALAVEVGALDPDAPDAVTEAAARPEFEAETDAEFEPQPEG